MDGDFLADQAAKGDGDCRRFRVPHAGVADQGALGLELLGIGFKEWLERGRAGFFLAFEQDGDAARQRPGCRLPGPAGLDESHQLALVVGGAAAGDRLAARGNFLDCRLEWRINPEIERIDRLHVVMAVKQIMRGIRRGAGMMGNDHGMAGGVAQAGVEAERCEFIDKPLTGAAALGRIGRVGRDRLDAQKTEQALEAVIEIGVGGGKGGGQVCHGMLRRESEEQRLEHRGIRQKKSRHGRRGRAMAAYCQDKGL